MSTRKMTIAAAAAAAGCLIVVLAGCGQPGHTTAATTAARHARPSATPPAAAQTPRTALIKVPDYVGRAFPDPLKGWPADLGIAIGLQRSSTVTAGSVISEVPLPGARVKANTTVMFVISTGPGIIQGAQPCQASQLRVQLGPLVSEATGQHTYDFSLTNTGSPCVLDGYPSLTALDASHRVIGFSYADHGDMMTTDAKPQPVYLPTGSAAWMRIVKYRCDLATSDTAATLQIGLPAGGGTVAVQGSLTGMDYCAEPASLKVAVSPFEPVQMLLAPRT